MDIRKNLWGCDHYVKDIFELALFGFYCITISSPCHVHIIKAFWGWDHYAKWIFSDLLTMFNL